MGRIMYSAEKNTVFHGEMGGKDWWNLSQIKICTSRSSNSILVPRELEQWAQRYSYLSPSGRIKRRRLRTGTALRQREQNNSLASNAPKDEGGFPGGFGRFG